MKYTTLVGKLMTLMVWGIMIVNLFRPFPDNADVALYILLVVTAVMHSLQMLMLYTLYANYMPLQKHDYLRVFIFGVFGLMEYRQHYNDYKNQQ